MAAAKNSSEGECGKNKGEMKTRASAAAATTSSATARVGGQETASDDWLDDDDDSGGGGATGTEASSRDIAEAEVGSVVDQPESSARENRRQLGGPRRRHRRAHRHCHLRHQQRHQQRHRCRHHHGHIKELIKPDPTVRQLKQTRLARMSASGPTRSPPLVADSSRVMRSTSTEQADATISAAFRTPPSSRVAVVVDEQQLQERLRESISEKNNRPQAIEADSGGQEGKRRPANKQQRSTLGSSSSSSSTSTSSSASSASHSSSHDADDEIDDMRSPPPAAIIIPANVAKSLSNRSSSRRESAPQLSITDRGQQVARESPKESASAAITREQLAYGPLLKPGEVQILYRSSDADSTSFDRHLKEEQAKLVAPNMRQSPIAIMSLNPTYELQNKPLVIEYPARVENLKLNNTGFSWEVKMPYQISMTTALYGAHLNQSFRYRLDQFHCHWGTNNGQGSEHTVDNNHYSAELHFVHYNMEKYHTMSKAARHPDGLVVLSVFLEASDEHHNHAELEKIVSHLKHVPLKGEHSIIRQAVHIENLLPQNRSYWSYQGSLTTPPYFESVTWFIFKHPIRCNSTQIQRFRSLRSSLRADDDNHRIEANYRKTQPLNGRSIVNYDEVHSGGANTNPTPPHSGTGSARAEGSH